MIPVHLAQMLVLKCYDQSIDFVLRLTTIVASLSNTPWSGVFNTRFIKPKPELNGTVFS